MTRNGNLRIRKNLSIIIVILSMFFLSCSHNNVVADSIYDISSLNDILLEQVDWTLDEYLAFLLTDENESKGVLTIKNITFGSFTGSGDEEIMVAFHVSGPHSASLDRTIMAIYDRTTFDIITQHTFAADTVEFHVISAPPNTHVLFIGDVTYQGISVYKAELYHLVGNQWIEIKIHDEPSGETSYFYSFTNNRILHIFTIEYDERFNPVLTYDRTLYFEGGEFRTRTPDK